MQRKNRSAVVILALVLLACAQASYAQDLIWAGQFGGPGPEFGRGGGVDGSGNVYVVGTFADTADLDPGPGIFEFTTDGGFTAFVVKLDGDGEFVWAGHLDGRHQDTGGSAVDSQGNVYIVGHFVSTADFDPGPGTFPITAEDTRVFVWKLDSLGSLVWVRQLGGLMAGAVTVDGAGNVYTVGHFTGTGDFDPGPGIVNLTSAGGFDVFVSKLDSTGEFVWVRQFSGTENLQLSAVVVDDSGSVFTTGTVIGTADFDPGPGVFNLTSAGWFDGFVSKLDSAGGFVWASRVGGTGADIPIGLELDADGREYVVGHFEETADFDPGPGTVARTSAGGSDAFVMALDGAGDLVWVRQLGGAGFDRADDVAVDANGVLHLVGTFGDTVDFDPDQGVFELTASGQGDGFFWTLDSAGVFMSARRVGGTEYTALGTLTLDGNGHVYSFAEFRSTVDFDPGPGSSFLMSSAGSTDTAVMKLGPSTCGDGRVDPGEECDDGNAERADGCDENCRIEEAQIPTLSEWSLILMALSLLTAGVFRLLRLS